jgi:hypothetical protein
MFNFSPTAFISTIIILKDDFVQVALRMGALKNTYILLPNFDNDRNVWTNFS